MSKRTAIREKRKKAARQRQLAIGIIIIGVSLAVVTYTIWQQNKPLGEFVQVTVTPHALSDGKSLGQANAPANVEIFEDFQCPYCRLFTEQVEPALIEQYVSTGKARLTYFHYTVVDSNTGGDESHRAAEASECAAQQGKFWEMHDVLFANQKGEGLGAFSDRRLIEMAKMVPELDQDAFESCFKSGGGRAAVQADLAIATRRNIRGTPTIFVNGVQVQNPLDFSEFQRLIDPLAPASR